MSDCSAQQTAYKEAVAKQQLDAAREAPLQVLRADAAAVAAAQIALEKCLGTVPTPETRLAPAMTTAGALVYTFVVRAEDGKIAWTRGTLGGVPEPWQLIPGDFTTDVPVAASASGDYLYVNAKPAGSAPSILFLNQGVPPNWVGWR